MLAIVAYVLVSEILVGAVRPDAARVERIMREFDAIETGHAWPGFDTASVPLMLYDGERTWLRGVDAWPDGFTPMGDVAVFEGRHPVHRANTAADLDGTWVATFELRPDTGPDAFRRLMVHESFHVHQNRAMPAHAEANEASLFTFPTTDGHELGARRLEVEALRRALSTAGNERRAWASRFVALRDERQAILGEHEALYERGIERKEGLCEYVAWASVSPDATREASPRALAADGMRDRAYWTGMALGRLLDGLRPGWQGEMVEDGTLHLDAMLAEAVAGAEPARFEDHFEREARERARSDAAAEKARRDALADAFLASPGWRVEIIASGPLWPAGFDPLNVVSMGDGRVLHTRFLKLQNDACELDVLDHRALTFGAGEHPLFNGVSRVVIAGLDEPAVERDGRSTTIGVGGVRVRVPADAVTIGEHDIRIDLPE